jgi:glycosyltransferase involved in cell wall biosynthesis
LKVAHITTVHPKNDNRILYKECISLKNAGYDVSLIVAGTSDDNINGIKIVGFKKEKNRFKRIVKTSFFDLLKICNRVDADIYHFHDPEIMFAGLILKLKGKKVIYDIHENNPAAILSKPYIKSKLLKKILSKMIDVTEKTIVTFFDAIVTARPDISERFKHKNIITLRNFPILPDFSKIKDIEIKKTKPSVIYVGGMSTIRGINELLEAFKLLENVELWLLGPVKEKSLEEKINSIDNVKYFGVVEPYEVFSYINMADIGIITFLEAPNHVKTLATKPFEYMACGKPIIMSNFKYWRETFGKSALYVDPSNPKDIADKINFLIKNKEMMEKMGKLNKELSKKEYNWEKESDKLLNLYKKLEKDVHD